MVVPAGASWRRRGTPEPSAARGFGLTTATALIVGSIIGVGIFNLPTSLAGYGPITLVSMGLTTVGALALALLFAACHGASRPTVARTPTPGWLMATPRFRQRLVVLDTAWAGNAAIAVGWVLYVEVFINKGHAKGLSVLLVLIGLWVRP